MLPAPGSPADLKGAKEELSPAGGGEQTHCEQDWPGIAALQEGSPAFPFLAPSPASSRAQAAAPQLQEQGPGLQTPAPGSLQQPPSVPGAQRLALPLLHAATRPTARRVLLSDTLCASSLRLLKWKEDEVEQQGGPGFPSSSLPAREGPAATS